MKYTRIIKSTFASLICLGILTACGGDDKPIIIYEPPISIPSKINLNLNSLVQDENGGALANIKLNIGQANKIIGSVISDNQGKIAPTTFNIDKDVDVIVSTASNDYIAQVKSLGKFNADGDSFVKLNLVKPNKKINMALNAQNTVSYNGSKVTFSGDAFVDSAGKTVTGNIDVSVSVLNPSKNPELFPGNPRIALANGESGYLASIGMVDFSFSQNGKKIQLKSDKTADIEIALSANYDDKGNVINIGDKIPLWSMDDNGTWKQEGEAIVAEQYTSDSALVAKASVTHFSWWNLDYPNPQIPKTVEIYSGQNCDTLYTSPISVFGTFSINNGNGPITRTGYEYVTNGSKTIGFPVGYDASLTADSQDQTLEINPAQKFTWANIQASNVIKLCLAPSKPSIVLYPDVPEIIVAKGNTYQLSYFIKNINKNVKWYINDIESSTLDANSTLGNIKNDVYYASGINYHSVNANVGTYTIKVAIADNLNVFDTIKIKVVDNLLLKNSVKINENNTIIDVFDGLATQNIDSSNAIANSLLYNQDNVLTPYLNGNKFPSNSFAISSMECKNLSEAVDICPTLTITKQNNIIRVAKKEFNGLNDFTANDLNNISEQYGNARLLVKGYLLGSDIKFEQSFTLRDLHNFNGYIVDWGYNNLSGKTTSKYYLQRFAGVDANAKLGLEQADILCVKKDAATGLRTMCPDAIAQKRPKIVLRKADKEIDIESPVADYDATAEYYLAGVLKDDIKGVRSSIVARVYCGTDSSTIKTICRPSYNNSNASSNISGSLISTQNSNIEESIELQMPISKLS
jgi:hypothetical protein